MANRPASLRLISIISHRLALTVVVCFLAGWLVAPADGGRKILLDQEVQVARLIEFGGVAAPQTANAGDEGEFAASAGLKTDVDMESRMEKADKLIEEGRLDLAIRLWQVALDTSGETVMTRDEWVYRTFNRKYRKYAAIAEEVERTIAGLKPSQLRIYRLSADGEAQALLAAGQGAQREEALGQVVRRYFLSSLGDDAAFELACLRLDRYDFVGASRLFSRILTDYPDPSVDRGAVLLRLALANSRVGDIEAANKALSQYKTLTGNDAPRLFDLVSTEVNAGDVGRPEATEDGGWPMLLGGPARIGRMPNLPVAVTNATLSEAWVGDFQMPLDQLASNPQTANLVLHGGLAMGKWSSYRAPVQQTQGPVSRESLISKWKSGGWNPAGQLLIHDGLVFYKQHNRVVCRDSRTGKLKWMSREAAYKGDPMAQWMAQMRRNSGIASNGQQPTGALEGLLFGDLVNQAMCIHDEVLYSVDGPMTDGVGPAVLGTNPQQARGWNHQQPPRRTRTNYLAAYNARNGKFKWVVGAGKGEDTKFEIGFMAAPVPFANFLLVPISDAGTISLAALDKETGKQVWKTFLCDEPTGGANPNSPLGISVDGGDCYVSTGGGVVMALDALSGDVRWAVRYQRATQSNPQFRNHGYPYNQMQNIDGWQQDVVIPHGRTLTVLASDSDKLFALDRRTGQLMWEAPRQPSQGDDASQYCLGVLDGGLYVGGKTSVRRYDLSGGKLTWETKIAESYGRGVLTADAIYVPVGESVSRLDPETGKQEATVGVFSPTKEPVGNLFSDGKQLLAAGLARVYALQDLTSRLEILAHRIENDDADAYLDRMRLRLRGEEHDNALADLRAAYALLTKQSGGAVANPAFYGGITELALVDRDPLGSLRLIADADGNLPEKDEYGKPKLETIVKERDRLIRQALQKIKKDETKGAAAEVLAAGSMLTERYLRDLARQTMAATATPENADVITAGTKSENPGERLVAMAGLVPALGQEQAVQLIGDLLNDADHDVRIESAIVLANQGDRRSLAALTDLLESEELQVRAKAVQSLRALTKQRFKYIAYEKPENREVAVAAWKQWLETDGEAAELFFPLADSRIMLGRTLVTFYSQGKVVELDADRKQVWELKVQQPWNAEGLPNGHRLICSYNGKFVAEYDDQGKEIWKMDGLPGYCSNAHRLENGNTLVTCTNVNQIMEVTPEKKIVWKQTVASNPQDARRLENGNTLVALQGAQKVVEIDHDGKVVWEVTNMRGPFSARRLPNGNTLIAQSGGAKVVEIDRDGKEVWSKTGLSTPYDAERLENGNTLIATSQGYREVDPQGKDLWTVRQSGALRINRY